MSKTYFFYLLGLALALLAARAQVSSYTQIDFNWSYTPNLPVCSTTNVSCFAGFTVTDLLSGHVVGTISTAARSWTYMPAGGVQYGKHRFTLVATGYDVNGNKVESAPATVVVDVEPPPRAPTMLQAVPQ